MLMAKTLRPGNQAYRKEVPSAGKQSKSPSSGAMGWAEIRAGCCRVQSGETKIEAAAGWLPWRDQCGPCVNLCPKDFPILCARSLANCRLVLNGPPGVTEPCARPDPGWEPQTGKTQPRRRLCYLIRRNWCRVELPAGLCIQKRAVNALHVAQRASNATGL